MGFVIIEQDNFITPAIGERSNDGSFVKIKTITDSGYYQSKVTIKSIHEGYWSIVGDITILGGNTQGNPIIYLKVGEKESLVQETPFDESVVMNWPSKIESKKIMNDKPEPIVDESTQVSESYPITDEELREILRTDDYTKQEINKIIHTSLKKQLEFGITPENIICKEGLELIFKVYDNSPACVKEQTISKLLERGWAISNDNDFSFDVVTPESSLAIFYAQPQLTSIILKQDSTVRVWCQ